MNFITASRGRFHDGSSRFRFIGVNDWDLGKVSRTTQQIQTTLDYMVQDGIKVVRVTTCGNQVNSTGNYRYRTGVTLNWREASFAQVDVMLDEMAKRGIRAIMSLSDRWNY